jgi:hypothetical protein
MEESMRGPLVVAEVVALGAILAFVEDTVIRVALGLLVGLLLARSALVSGRAESGERPPSGLDDRRQDHLFRHWINVLLKKVREFHTVCQGVATGGVNMAVGQLRIHEIEKEIQELLSQVTDAAKPNDLKRRGKRTGAGGGRKPADT